MFEQNNSNFKQGSFIYFKKLNKYSHFPKLQQHKKYTILKIGVLMILKQVGLQVEEDLEKCMQQGTKNNLREIKNEFIVALKVISKRLVMKDEACDLVRREIEI